MTDETSRKRLAPEEALRSLTADHRRLICQASFEEPIHSPAGYTIEAAATESDSPRRIEALHITQFGRFGNLLVQIGHALDVAYYLGVDTIYYDITVQAPGVFEDSSSVEIDGKRLIAISHASPSVEKTLKGTFWSLHLLIAPEMQDLCKRDVVPSQKLFALLSSEIRDNLFPVQSIDVIAHFRGGDIFYNELNLDYVQPPFSFYRKTLTEVIARQPGAVVHVVCEDHINPAVDATIAWLKDNGQAYQVHSGDLKDDLKVMFAAPTIVSSYGTFVSAVLKLSPKIRAVFSFENMWVSEAQRRFRPDVELRRYVDAQGGYTKHGDWRSTNEQIALIVDYDIGSIVEMV